MKTRGTSRVRTRAAAAVAAVAAIAAGSLAGAPTAGAATSRAVGVSSSTIRIGVTYVSLASVEQFVHGLNQGNFKADYQALIDHLNSTGGINGRKVRATYVGVSPLGTASDAAACTQLTQDDQVFAVLGYTMSPLCYVSLHDTAFIGGTPTTQLLAQAKAPWFSTTPVENILEPAVATAAARSGVFKGKKVAVLSQTDAPPDLASSVIAALKRGGVKPVATAIAQVDASDPSASQQQISGVIAQKFQSVGANMIVLVENSGQSWPEATGSGTYHPTMVATDSNALNTYAATGNKSLLTGTVSGGVTPAVTGNQPVGWNDPALQRCVHVIEKATGQRIVDPVEHPNTSDQNYVAVEAACQDLTLFEAIAKKAGHTLTDASFTTAGDTLGAVHIPGQGTGVYSKSNPGGAFPLYLYRWNAARNQFVSSAQPSAST